MLVDELIEMERREMSECDEKDGGREGPSCEMMFGWLFLARARRISC